MRQQDRDQWQNEQEDRAEYVEDLRRFRDTNPRRARRLPSAPELREATRTAMAVWNCVEFMAGLR